jgi:hypothetical protein
MGAQGRCPKCGFELHSCKQCTHFDPGTRFECRQPITARIPRKDEMNACSYYTMSVRVERATGSATASTPAPSASNNNGGFTTGSTGNRVEDARRAFDALFKK